MSDLDPAQRKQKPKRTKHPKWRCIHICTTWDNAITMHKHYQGQGRDVRIRTVGDGSTLIEEYR